MVYVCFLHIPTLEGYCLELLFLKPFNFRCGSYSAQMKRSGGAMVLDKLLVPGVLLIWIRVGQGPTALAVGAGGGCLDIFFSCLSFVFFFLPLSGRRPDID